MSFRVPDTPFPAAELYSRVISDKQPQEEVASIYIEDTGDQFRAVGEFTSSGNAEGNAESPEIEFSTREVVVNITSNELCDAIRDTINAFNESWESQHTDSSQLDENSIIEYSRGLWRIQTIVRVEKEDASWSDCKQLLVNTSPLVTRQDDITKFTVRIAHENAANQFDYTVWVDAGRNTNDGQVHTHLPTDTSPLDSWVREFLETHSKDIICRNATQSHAYELTTDFDGYTLEYSIAQPVGVLPNVPDADSQLSS